VVAHQVGQSVRLRQISAYKNSVWRNGGAISPRQVIEYHNVVTALEQQTHGMGTDVTGTAGDKDTHSSSFEGSVGFDHTAGLRDLT
jgi:hypothetical protein